MWYQKIVEDLEQLPAFIDYYNAELIKGRYEVKIQGSLEKNIAALPGMVEQRFNQLQEIEAVLEYLNIQLRKIKRKYFQKYLETYNKALSSRDAEKYSDGETEVIEYDLLINEVALVRNSYLGLIKGLENKSFSLSNISKLRTAGLENITL